MSKAEEKMQTHVLSPRDYCLNEPLDVLGEPYLVKLADADIHIRRSAESSHEKGEDLPAWLLDTDYNGLCFHVSQAFFPRTSAWEALKKALKAHYEETVWDHLAGTVSAPFEPNGQGEIAVKVIDDRGNELMVTRKIAEAKKAK